jgi:maltose alpha-D-glucosyltransferase/alpha-amylase
VNVENQLNNPHSLLWWMKRMIALRKQSKAFGRGDLRLLFPDNRRVFAFLRSYDDENILVVANLSRFTQYAEIPLAEFQGMTPVEMFGRTDFPPISDKPYFISLGPHAFNWFVLERRAVAEVIEDGAEPGRIPVFPVASWQTPLGPETRRAMTALLPSFLRQRRWFLGRSRPIRSAGIQDVIPFPRAESYLVILRVEYSQGEPENYVVPLSIARGEAATVLEEKPQVVMARLEGPDGARGVLYSGLRNPAFCNELVGVIARRRRFPGEHGELTGAHTRAFRVLYGAERQAMDPVPAKADQRNSSVIFGDRFVLKLIRRVEPGSNPEREIGELLTRQAPRVQVAPLAGSLEYRGPGAEPMTVAVLHGYERNETHGWQYTLDNLGLFFAQAQAVATAPDAALLAPKPLIEIAGAQAPELARQLIGSYLEMIRLLGQRTAEIHAALASDPENPAFAPEPYSDFYRHSLYHGMIGHAGRVLAQLRRSLNRLPAEAQAISRRLIDSENSLREKLKQLRDRRIQAVRIRNHGDFHLGQVLYTGRDWILIDFEGDPERPLSERRIKRSPLTDAAGMLRSLHYASQAVLYGQVPGVVPVREAAPSLGVWANFWYRWASAAFLGGYLDVPAAAALLPSSRDDLRLLLECFLIDKAIREVDYELNHRPDWVLIPVLGLLELVETAS